MELARVAEPEFDIEADDSLVTFVAMTVLLTNMESMALFHMPVSGLLERVSNGDDDALFQAVILDASVLHAKPIADRISTAAFYDDRSFFNRLSKAITKTKPARPKGHLDETRLLMQFLDDAGLLEKMSDAKLTDMAVNKVGVYPATGDPESAIRDQRRKRDRAKGGPKS